MDNNIGWISLHREIREHWIWQDGEKFKWWMDILLTVNVSDAKVVLGNDVYDCKRGETLRSLTNWADRWKVSKDTARNFLKLLLKANMIECVSIGKSTRITVCNYDSYQQGLHVNQTRDLRKPNGRSTQYNNDNKEDNKREYAPFVFLKTKEYEKLCADLGREFAERCIVHLSKYYTEKPSKKKDSADHNLTIRRWVVKAVKQDDLDMKKLNGQSRAVDQSGNAKLFEVA